MRRRPPHFPVKRPTGSFVNSEPSSISKSSRIPVSQRRLRRPLRPACAAVNPLNTVSEPTPMLAGLASERSAGQSKIRRCIEIVSPPSTPATQNADRLGRERARPPAPETPKELKGAHERFRAHLFEVVDPKSIGLTVDHFRGPGSVTIARLAAAWQYSPARWQFCGGRWHFLCVPVSRGG